MALTATNNTIGKVFVEHLTMEGPKAVLGRNLEVPISQFLDAGLTEGTFIDMYGAKVTFSGAKFLGS